MKEKLLVEKARDDLEEKASEKGYYGFVKFLEQDAPMVHFTLQEGEERKIQCSLYNENDIGTFIFNVHGLSNEFIKIEKNI